MGRLASRWSKHIKFSKKKTQRAVITIKDNDKGGFNASITYEPSVRKLDRDSPAVNTAVRLSLILQKHKDELGLPLKKQSDIIITDAPRPLGIH